MVRRIVRVIIPLLVVGAVVYGVIWVFQPRASNEPLKYAGDLEKMCAGGPARRYFPQVDAYGGSGPHPVAMFRGGSFGPSSVPANGADLPEYWNGGGLDPERVQLVICMGDPDDGGMVKTCEFKTSSLPLHRGMYNATLYEAKTRRKIATGRLEGSTAEGCPSMHVSRKGDDKIFTSPDFAEIRNVFGSYVDS